MKLTCNQKDLNQALSLVNRAVNSNNTLPVLNNILLRAEGKQLYLCATNLEITMSATIPASIENEGALTVPAKAFTSYVALIQDEAVHLDVKNGATLEITSTGSDTSMKGISSEEFPLLPKLTNAQNFKVPTENLKEAIEQVAFAASTNISRPVLTGLFWKIEGNTMKLVATDSYRLAEKTMQFEQAFDLETNFIVPARTAQELAKIVGGTLAKEVEVSVSKGQIQFSVDGVILISRLIEGNFPDYEKILPSESKSQAELLTSDFMLALKKVSVIVRENNNNVKVRLGNGKLQIASDETQVGQGSAELETLVQGEEHEAALNAQYLLDVLSHLGDKNVKFGLNDGLSPVKVVPAQKESGYVHIIMPLKV